MLLNKKFKSYLIIIENFLKTKNLKLLITTKYIYIY